MATAAASGIYDTLGPKGLLGVVVIVGGAGYLLLNYTDLGKMLKGAVGVITNPLSVPKKVYGESLNFIDEELMQLYGVDRASFDKFHEKAKADNYAKLTPVQRTAFKVHDKLFGWFS